VDVRAFFDWAGDAVRSGGDVYAARYNVAEGFFWAPPWAVVYATVTWLPWEAIWAVTAVAELAALRYLCGSWLGVGVALWVPLMPFEFASGNINLVIAAALVAAQRGRPELLAVVSFAKISPALALPPRQWRRFAVIAVVAIAITIPWLRLWPEWIEALLRALGNGGVGPAIPIPLWLRLALAVPLLLIQRPATRALGAILAIPGLYWQSLVLLLAPAALVLRPPATAIVSRPADVQATQAFTRGSRARSPRPAASRQT
jgi:hypothetical protein